ncbi:MAG: dihydroneopterin aldolase [Cyclobacteriaceae bacterium]
MGKIILEEMQFFAYHGYYEEERKIGNRYSVTLEVETDFGKAAQDDQLSGTINYEELYAIVKKVMEVPAKLLEHVAQTIIDEIRDQYGQGIRAEISISKHNPPLGGICGRSTIVLTDRG